MDLEEDKVKSEEFKTKGNDHFKKKEYAAAVENYTNAISMPLFYFVYSFYNHSHSFTHQVRSFLRHRNLFHQRF